MTGKEVVNFRGIKALGIPYSRAHVWRLMSASEFPQCFKLGPHRNSHPVWWVSKIDEWLDRHSKR